MTSLREVIRRLILEMRRPSRSPAEISYLAEWTSRVGSWDAERRRRSQIAIKRILQQPGFFGSQFGRHYLVHELDTAVHSGASLLALLKVLNAYEADAFKNGESNDQGS